jgi:hypothetical protein
MLDTLTEASFTPHIGTEFRIAIDPARSIVAVLVDVTVRHGRRAPAPWDSNPRPEREPFSIVFRGPLDPPLLQRMYHVEHEAIGVIKDLFLVPVGINQDGRFYEAVFN